MPKLTYLLIPLLLLAGCVPPASLVPHAGPAESSLASRQVAATSLTGRVSFGNRSAQASMTDVASGATVSLINAGTNLTVSTALTDAAGAFTLLFTGGFVADPTAIYYLEAVKGQNANRPGAPALRVRTLVKYSDGWTSLSNSTPNVGIVVNPSTTALSIGAALKNANPSAFDFASLIGRLAIGTPDVYSAVAGLSSADYSTLVGMVQGLLNDDRDPVANVGLVAPSTWRRLNVAPTILSVSPATGTVGTAIEVVGTGFHPTAASDALTFNGASAPVQTASETRLTATVPATATSGPLTVRVGDLTVLGPTFGVVPTLTGFTPTRVFPGDTVTLMGTAFDGVSLANNMVLCNGLVTTLVSATRTSLTIRIPRYATSGPLTVSVAGQQVTSTQSLEVLRTLQTVIGNGTGSYSGDGGVASNATVNHPNGMVRDAAGNLYIADPDNSRLRRVAPDGVITTFAGDGTYSLGSPATGVQATSTFAQPGDVAMDRAGNVYYTDFGIWVRKVTPQGVVTTVAGIHPVDGGTYDFSSGTVRATDAHFESACALDLDAAGNLYIVDRPYGVVLKVDTQGVIKVFAGNYSDVYPGDNVPATSVGLKTPEDVLVDPAGNVLIADTGHGCVRKVDANGLITTIVGKGTVGFSGDGGLARNAQLNGPRRLALDAAGNLFVLDWLRLRMVDTDGYIQTLAGNGTAGFAGDNGRLSLTQFNYPMGLAVGDMGAIYVADTGNHRIRRLQY